MVLILKKFDQIRQENNLKGWIKKNSNVVCEYIITSDSEYFNSIGEEETQRFFKTAFSFVKSYKNLGEKYILSANVHLDEATPHLHLVFIPVVHSFDKKSGKVTDKICCSDFWKGRDSYKILQDNFHKYMVRAGFNVERGLEVGRKNIPIKKYKELTNYEMQKYRMQNINLEKEKEIIDTEELKKEYKRVIRKFNKLAKQYTRVKTITDTIIQKQETLQNENKEIIQENRKLENENNYLKNFIDKTFEYVSILFDFPKERLKRLVKNFVDMMKGE